MGVLSSPFRIAAYMDNAAVSAYLHDDGSVRGGGAAAFDVRRDGTVLVRAPERHLSVPELHAAACVAKAIIHPDFKTVVMADWMSVTRQACLEATLSTSFAIGYAVSPKGIREIRFVRMVGPWSGYSSDPLSDANASRRVLCHDIETGEAAEKSFGPGLFEKNIRSWASPERIVIVEDDIDCTDGIHPERLSDRAYVGAMAEAAAAGGGRLYLELASPSHCAGAGWAILGTGAALPYESSAVVFGGKDGSAETLNEWIGEKRRKGKKSLPFRVPSV